MLRYAYLPSDFHPQFLILGERGDIGELVERLRSFANDPQRCEVAHEQTDDAAQAARLILTPAAETTGLHRDPPTSDAFEWRLDAHGANVFADLIDEALAAPEPANSLILEVRQPGEIPVKISFGEFTDQFLVEDF